MRTERLNTAPHIAGAGVCCLDHIVIAPQIAWGESTHVSNYFAQGGGLVATALVACARLGARCDLFSLVGDDQVGDQIVAELVAEGVATAGVMRIEGSSPFSLIHVDEHSGERTIFHRTGRGLEWHPGAHDLRAIGKCDVLLIDHVYPALALAAADEARAHGVPVVADVMPSARNAELLRRVDVLIAPRHFARAIGCKGDLDAALDAIHELGPTTAVITLGADGWVSSDSSGRGRGSAFQVEVVDTTGAGDVFHGAFAYGLARGWDTARCAEFASAVAAIKCTKPGGRTGLPSLAQAVAFLRERSRLDWSGVVDER